jgi:hypothetical protein
MEREAVMDERSLMRDALRHTMGDARLSDVRTEFERRTVEGNLIEIESRVGSADRRFTTREMQGYERDLINRMKQGQNSQQVLANGDIRQETMERDSHLSASQRRAVDTVLTSRDKMLALEGLPELVRQHP